MRAIDSVSEGTIFIYRFPALVKPAYKGKTVCFVPVKVLMIDSYICLRNDLLID